MRQQIANLPPVIRAVMWMGGTIISFLLMMVSARELVDTFSTLEILAFRSGVALLVLSPVALRLGFARMATRRFGMHVTRNAFHLGGQVTWVIGVTLLPLAQVTALEFTTPLWAALLAVIFLKEKISRHRAVAVGLGFAGILIILRPGVGVFSTAALLVLAGMVLYAISHVATKELTRTESAMQIVFYMQAIQLPLVLFLWLIMALFASLFPTMFPAPLAWSQPGWGDAPWLIFIGITALSAHYCMTRAMMLADVSVILPIDFLRLPLITVIAWFTYAEAIDPFVLLGAAIIFGGNYYSVREEARGPDQKLREEARS